MQISAKEREATARLELIKLGKDWTRKSVESNFLTIYLTLLSIIQGVALSSLFAGSAKELFRWQADKGYFVFLGYFLATVGVLGAVWHEFMVVGLLMRWLPKRLDSLVPFGLGFFEFLLVYAVLSKKWPQWFLFLGLTAACGALAYWNNLRNLELDVHYEDPGGRGGCLREYFRHEKKDGIVFMLACALFFVAFFLAYYFFRPLGRYWVSLADPVGLILAFAALAWMLDRRSRSMDRYFDALLQETDGREAS